MFPKPDKDPLKKMLDGVMNGPRGLDARRSRMVTRKQFKQILSHRVDAEMVNQYIQILRKIDQRRAMELERAIDESIDEFLRDWVEDDMRTEIFLEEVDKKLDELEPEIRDKVKERMGLRR